MRAALLIFALAASGLAGSATLSRDARAAVDPAVDRGQSVAERRCAECHAIRPGRHSKDGDAPPFSVLRLRYNELSLARRINAVTRGTHAGMPPTPTSDTDRKDLVIYIQSLGADER